MACTRDGTSGRKLIIGKFLLVGIALLMLFNLSSVIMSFGVDSMQSFTEPITKISNPIKVIYPYWTLLKAKSAEFKIKIVFSAFILPFLDPVRTFDIHLIRNEKCLASPQNNPVSRE